jgi:hypothetical protein
MGERVKIDFSKGVVQLTNEIQPEAIRLLHDIGVKPCVINAILKGQSYGKNDKR